MEKLVDWIDSCAKAGARAVRVKTDGNAEAARGKDCWELSRSACRGPGARESALREIQLCHSLLLPAFLPPA